MIDNTTLTRLKDVGF